MINLSSTITHESATVPGVTFTVRVANQYERTKMEAEIIEQFLELRDLQRKIFEEFTDTELVRQATDLLVQLEPVMTNGNKPLLDQTRELISAFQAAKVETPEVRGAGVRAGMLMERDIKPATIRAQFVSIEGIGVDGDPVATADQVIKLLPGALVTEIYTRCQEAATLTADQLGNLHSPGGSARQTDGQMSDTTAPNASGAVTTKSATVESTSPRT